MSDDPTDPADPELHLVLRDGTRALIRPIRPEDKEKLEAGLALLSPRSRYLRFHQVIDHLTEEQLRYFTEIDHRDHMAWVAIDEDRPEAPGMGVARYIRLAEDPTIAEAALTVLDEYQGRGLGTVLLAVLGESAVANGIRTFRNYVLGQNRAMLEMFQELGADVAEEPFGVYRVDYPLPEDPEDLPDTPAGRAVREVGSQTANLALGPPLWLEDHSEAPAAPTRTSHHERGDLRDWLDATFGDDT